MSRVVSFRDKEQREFEKLLEKGKISCLETLEELKNKVNNDEVVELLILTTSSSGDPDVFHSGTVANPFLMSYHIKYQWDVYNYMYCMPHVSMDEGGIQDE